MKLFNLKKIGESNPAQWTATNEQGEQVYIRFRFDTLTVHCPFDLDDEKQNYKSFMAVQILDMRDVYDDEYRGALDTDEMLALTGYTLESRAIAHWITQARDMEAMLGCPLNDEDEQRLRQISEWCESSPHLWEVITRIGWEIHEG